MLSTKAYKLAFFEIPTRENIQRYQCDNPPYYLALVFSLVSIYIFFQVVSINHKKKKVVLDNGKEIQYGKLLIATGKK